MCACSESTTIRSEPAGANVWVNSRLVGKTPVEYVVSRSQWPENGEFRYRIEKDGYVAKQGSFHEVTGGGRVTSAIATLGLSLIFKRATTLENEYVFELEPAATSNETQSLSVEQRLRRLRELLDRGLIDEQEYKQQRAEILRGL
jgi:hypothetical protein